MTVDPYAALGLTKSASDADIKKAYRKIARSCHPDLKPDDSKAEEKFKIASAAYDLLKDPETRAKFDRGEVDASGAERPQQQQYYRDYAEAPGNPYRSGQGFEGHNDMSDIFADFLRQRGQEGASFQSRGFDARGADQRYMLNVPFLDAVRGGKTQITLPDGSGIEVKIPEGTTDGQIIRLRGKGAQGYGNGPAGDALVTLSVASHPMFERDGNDILITLPITLDEAVLGGKVATPTISGTVNLSIPKGATSGQTLRLRGRGVKGRGDQKVTFSIVSPPKIDAELAEFMEGWRKSNAYDPRKGMIA
jgi:DnaJ-class molecular chaperone